MQGTLYFEAFSFKSGRKVRKNENKNFARTFVDKNKDDLR